MNEEPRDATAPVDQLRLLFDYTKFHIGIYISLGSALIAAAATILTADKNESSGYYHDNIARFEFLSFSVVCLFVAGWAGGIIAGNLHKAKSFKDFSEKRIGFWGGELLPYNYWAWLEHTAFWLALASLAYGFLFQSQPSCCTFTTAVISAVVILSVIRWIGPKVTKWIFSPSDDAPRGGRDGCTGSTQCLGDTVPPGC